MATGKFQTVPVKIRGSHKCVGVQAPYPLTEPEWNSFIAALVARKYEFVKAG